MAAYRDYNGKLRVDQSYRISTGEGAALGGLVGMMLGSIIAIPFTAGASAAAATAIAVGSLGGGALGAGAGALDASTWKDAYGISEDFVRSVGTMIQPGDSAIFAMLRTLDRQRVSDAFRGYGGTILTTSLNLDQQARVEATLHNR